MHLYGTSSGLFDNRSAGSINGKENLINNVDSPFFLWLLSIFAVVFGFRNIMEIIKNYLKYSLWFVLVVFAVLLGLHWLPAVTIDGHTMRRVDLLSDLRYPDADTAVADSDSIPLPPVVNRFS